MHPALDNFDILSEIFDYVPCNPIGDYLDMSDRRTLAKTARVCKAFSDPALNILWRHLFTLLPLFNLFPVSLLTFPGDPKYCLDGEVAEHDLERFQRYARRVRSVAYYGAPGPIDPSVYFYVSRELNGVSLLPCSRSLHWIQESAYDTSITTLLSPSLRALYLDLEFADSEMTKSISYNANSGQYIALEMLLERAFQVSPFLEEFTIMYLYHPPKMFPFSTLQHLSKVLFLSCSALTISHAFQTLSALPNLVHLVLDISGDDEEETQLSYCSGFLALQKLKITGELPCLEAIVSAVSSPVLELLELCVTTSSQNNPEECAGVLTTVGSRWSTSLHTLKLILHRNSDSDAINMPLTQFLRPALALGALTRLELTALMALTVSDADMRVLASSYPLLQVLRLQFQVHTTDYANTVPTFSALLDFARRLSELRDLAVPFWLDGTALDTLMAHPDLASRALRRLNVLRGILEVAEDELAHVAECIDAAFPNLGPLCRRGKRYGLKWPQVNRTLMSLQNARREGVMSVC